MYPLFQGIRYSLRQLRHNAGFTATALLTIALSLGANLTIFAVVESILLRPLPFPSADRLVVLYSTYPKAGKDRDNVSIRSYYERRGKIPAFVGLAGLNPAISVLGEAGSSERADIGRVTPEFFSTLGVPLAMGRPFEESELTYQTDQEAILTDSYWRTHYNADPNVLGKFVRSDGIPRRIVGVLPPSFSFLSSKMQIFLPLSSEESEHNLAARHANTVVEIARLAPGATLAQAQAQVDADNEAHAAEFPFAKEVAGAGYRTIVAPLHADHVASIRPAVLLLQLGALSLLMIGGVNLINLLLIRSSTRARELAIRQSMGAQRVHIVTQVMTETILLALLGGLCALAVAAGGVQLLGTLGASQLPLGANIAVDWRLAAAAVIGSVALGVLIALPIAWFNLRSHPTGALQSESRSGTTGRFANRLRYSFIVAQITLAFILLSGAGLLGLSLKRVAAVSPGFNADHVLTGRFSLSWKGYNTGPQFLGFTDRLIDAASHQPGVVSVGGISAIPLGGPNGGGDVISAVGYNPAPGESIVNFDTFGVFGDYFSAMGIPLRAGRFLVNADNHKPERVVVIDENFAHRFWPHGSAIGQRIFNIPRKPDDSNVFTVVGVVGNVKQRGLTARASTGTVYFPYINLFSRNYFLVARSSMPPEALSNTMSRMVRNLDPEIPLSDVQTMKGRIDDSLTTRRSPAMLTSIFAGVALLLAAIGTYGVLSYAVSQRRREIGIRMALGAPRQQVQAHFLGVGARLLAIGVALGIVGAWAAGRAMQSVLFGVGAFQPGILLLTCGLMFFVVLLACYVPARRAAGVDPMEALRHD